MLWYTCRGCRAALQEAGLASGLRQLQAGPVQGSGELETLQRGWVRVCSGAPVFPDHLPESSLVLLRGRAGRRRRPGRATRQQ